MVKYMIAVAASMLLLTGVTCGIAQLSSDMIYTDARGRPLDYAGNLLRCPHCRQGIGYHQDGYSYRCEVCSRVFVARLIDGGRGIQFDENDE